MPHTAIIDWRTARRAIRSLQLKKLIGRAAKVTRHLIATCHAAFCSLESKIEMRSTSARIALAAVTVTKLENVMNGIE
jgi:hypothetical protein